MRLVFGTTTLADSADLTMVPRDFAMNGRQTEIDESHPINAATVTMYGRGNRRVECSVTVDYGFATYEEAAEYALLKWSTLDDQADLYLVFDDSTVLLEDAVLTGPELVPGTLTENATLVRWSWMGGAFTSASGADVVSSILTGETLTPSATGNSTLTIAASHRATSVLVQAAAGAGSYTHKVILPTTDRENGDIVEGRLELPASANPTIEFRNATSGGTLLGSRAGTTLGATNYTFRFTYRSTAWVLDHILNIA